MDTLRAPKARVHQVPDTIDGIAVVRWPEEAARAEELARNRTPRLFLIADEADIPDFDDDDFVDCVHDSADEHTIQTRVVALRNAASAVRPIVDDHGVVWRGATWVALSPIEARMTRLFLGRPGRVLTRARLEAAGWPEGVSSSRAIDARIMVLRPRLAQAGIRIHTVRGRGYLVEIQPEVP